MQITSTYKSKIQLLWYKVDLLVLYKKLIFTRNAIVIPPCPTLLPSSIKTCLQLQIKNKKPELRCVYHPTIRDKLIGGVVRSDFTIDFLCKWASAWSRSHCDVMIFIRESIKIINWMLQFSIIFQILLMTWVVTQ